MASGNERGRVLVLDDDASMRRSLVDDLLDLGFRCESAGTTAEARTILSAGPIDALVTDVRLTGENGIQFAKEMRELRPDVPVVVMSAFGTPDAARDAMHAGAYDFISKPFDVDVMGFALDRAIRTHRLEREVQELAQQVGATSNIPGIVGESRALDVCVKLVERVAPTDVNVLLTGETGTGKEVFAKAIHAASGRRSRPFVAVNCAAVPESLLESQLFGHVKGAFTDAKTSAPGLFAEAQGGTLFLDEIGHMPLSLQPKILRALQERMVRPVGGKAEISVDVRLICATHVDLESAAEAGEFRADLFYRINVVQIDLPPLRTRENDILLLAQHFLDVFRARMAKESRQFSPSVAERLLSYPWPGNVRELSNAVERAVALSSGTMIEIDDLPNRVRAFASAQKVRVDEGDPTELVTLDEMEKRYILHVMASARGNRGHAARILGIDRKTLYRKLTRFGAVDDDERE